MCESIYNITLMNHPIQGYKTVYNLLTKECICIKENIELNDSLPPSYVQSLLDRGFLVSTPSDDLKKAERLYLDLCNNEVLTLTVFLTNHCNCKCVYCYESPWEISALNDPKLLASKIISEANARGLKKIFISFFGGEPLLNIPAIYSMATILHDEFQGNFSFSVVTNGTLLTSNDVESWIPLGLESIKVTIDGNRSIHNARRPYHNGRGTYDAIINNLATISGRVSIIINIVLDQNVTSITGLLDDLKLRNIKAEFDLSLCDPFLAPDEEKSELISRFSAELKYRGFVQHSALSHPHGVVCMHKRLNSYGCTDSLIYSCIGSLGSQLNSGGEFTRKEIFKIPCRCKQCKFLPICFGGCAKTNDCNLHLFEIMVPALLRVYIGEA